MASNGIDSVAKLFAMSAKSNTGEEHTIFDAICDGKIPAQIVYEDEKCMAFRDVNPVTPTHILLIPKTAHKMGLSQLSKAEEGIHEEILGHLMVKIPKIAAQEGLKDGFRIVINDGKQGCQSVYHLHIHIIGGQ